MNQQASGRGRGVRLWWARLRAVITLGALLGSSAAMAQVTVSLTGPATYTPGSPATLSFVVSNGTPATTADISTAFTGATLAWTCSAAAGSTCGAGAGSGPINHTSTLGANSSVTYTINATYAASSTAAVNPSAEADPPGVSNAVSDGHAMTVARVSDLAVTKTSAMTTYAPGGTGRFTVAVSNVGPSDAFDIEFTDNEPANVDFTSWACIRTPGNVSCGADANGGSISQSLDIAAGQTFTYTIQASYDAAATAASITNTASIAVVAGDGDTLTTDNSASVTVNRDPLSYLTLAFAPNAGLTYIPGSYDNALTLTVANPGPATATGPLNFFFPASAVDDAAWSCVPAAACSPSSGTINRQGDPDELTTTLTLAAAASVVITFDIDYDSGALASPLELAAAVDVNGAPGVDPVNDPADRRATNSYTINRRADLEVSKSGPAVISPGAPFTYFLEVTNIGPSDVGNGAGEDGILIDDILPATLRGDPAKCIANPGQPCWTYCPSDGGIPGDYTVSTCPVAVVSGVGSLSDLPMRLRRDSSSQVEIYVATDLTTRGDVTNTASIALEAVTPAVTEVSGTNNSDSATTTVQPNTDIVVDKTDGETQIGAGETLSYTITVSNAGFETANAVLVNDVLPLFGGMQTAGFVPGSISWQCSATGGACCTHNGAANTCGTTTPTAVVTADVLNASVDLPNRLSQVVFTVTGTVAPSASGTLFNSATATLPLGLSDTDSTNNDGCVVPADATTQSDCDVTTLVTDADLSIAKRLIALTPDNGPPFTLTYEILVSNAGPSRVDDALVSDVISPTLLRPETAAWTCSVVSNPGGNTRCDAPPASFPLNTLTNTVDLDAGGTVRFELSVQTTSGAAGTITNTAEVTGGGTTQSSTAATNLAGTGELSITKTSTNTPPDEAIPGTEIEYLIRVQNSGPDDAFRVSVTDALPTGLENATWSCAATTPVPGDLSYFDQVGGTTGARALVTSADGRHVYVASNTTASLSAYDRVNIPGAGFGNVAPLETETDQVNDIQDVGASVTGMQRPIDVAISPDQSMVFVLSGPLAEIPGPPVVPARPASIAAFNRVTNPLDLAYGELSFAGSVPIAAEGFEPARLIVSSNAVYASGTGTGGARLAVFRRSLTSGLPVADATPLDVTANVPQQPGAMVISALDAALFVASSGSTGTARVARFRIETADGSLPAGRLSFEASVSDAGMNGITDLVIAPAERQVYALAAGSENLVELSYETGLDASLPVSATDLGVGGTRPFAADARMTLAPDGEHLLITNAGTAPSSAALIWLRRDPSSGSLSFDQAFHGSAAQGISGAGDVEVTSDGRHVAIAIRTSGAGAEQLTVYARRAPDPLFGFIEVDRQNDNPGPISGLNAPADIAVSPDGNHVYVVSLETGDPTEGAVALFRRDVRSTSDASGVHLTWVATYRNGQSGISGIGGAGRVLISPDGANVYVSSEDNGTVTAFSRAGDGTLTFIATVRDGDGGVDGLLGAQGMAMDRNSANLYVAGTFDNAVAAFRRQPNGSLAWIGMVKAGVNGATGMGGMRDLVVSGDGLQVMGVSSLSNAVVVMSRDDGSDVPADAGKLRFLQARTVTGVRMMSLAIPSTGIDAFDNEHVYAVGQDDSSIIVLKREVDPTSTAFGTLSTLFEYRGLPGLSGPRDVAVSPDGRRVFVGSQFSSSILIFDRDRNRSSQNYGALSLVEVRSDGADGVDGLNSLYAIASSGDSRNVYVAGFGDRAVASFEVGAGSFCSAAGGGDVIDTVNIGANGTLEYRVRAFIRADATGSLVNRACVDAPDPFIDTGEAPDGTNCSVHTATLTPQGDVAISKTNDRVSVAAGEFVRYEVRVANPGPSNLVHDASSPLTVTDLLDSNPGFVPGTATWSCLASGSGSLDFVAAYRDGDPGITGLAGVTDVARVADPDGAGAANPLTGYLAAVGLLDDAVTLFSRDPATGALMPRVTVSQGNAPLNQLVGARAVLASGDGKFLYVAARVSDAINVFAVEDDGMGAVQLRHVEAIRGELGLDQVSHLAASPDFRFVYAAGANDDAVAVFERNPTDGRLTHVESEVQGSDDGSDDGGVPDGLDGVEFLLVSPDGAHLYAISSLGGSIARFDRDGITGRLAWREVANGSSLGMGMDGASAAAIDADGSHLYLAAADANRVLVLARGNQASQVATFGRLTLASSLTQEQGGTLGLLGPRRLALSSDGAHLYVTAQSGSSIAWFGRDAQSGGLRYLGQRSSDSADVQGLAGATGLVIDPDTNQVYVAGTLESAIAQFARQSDSVCPASGSGDLAAIPVNIAAGGSVTFTIDVQVSPTLSGPLTNSASVIAAADPASGNNSASDVDEPSVVADLRITKDDGLAAYDGLAGARAIVGTDDHLYVAGPEDNAIGVFVRDSLPASADFGALRFTAASRGGVDGVLGLNAVADLALSADAAHLYAVSPVDNSVATFARSNVDGTLAFVELQRNGVLGVTGMSGARALALSPDGRHVYVASEFSNAIVAFARQHDAGLANHGRLTYLGVVQQGVAGVTGLASPVALQVSPDGRHLYALSSNGNSIAVFLRNPNPASGGFGQLAFSRAYQGNVGAGSGLEGGRALLINASGDHLYVLGAEPGSLAHFSRTVASGELALVTLAEEGVAGAGGLVGAQRLALSADGSVLYVATGSGDAIAAYALDAATGVPTVAARTSEGDDAGAGEVVLGLEGVSGAFATPDGAHLYTVAAIDDALSGFQRVGGGEPGELDWRETFFDGQGGVAPGAQVRYRIEVSNTGPADVVAARIVDVFPEQFVSASWTCVEEFAGGECDPSGQGNLDTLADLPAGARVVYEAVGQLGDSVGGTLVNTATVSATDALDPDVSNNSATDGNTVLSPALDLRAVVTATSGNGLPGGRIDYEVEVRNIGPTYAEGARVTERLPDALLDTAWTCRAFPVAGALTQLTPTAIPLSTSVAITGIEAGAIGQHVYVTALIDGVDTVLALARDPLDGTLTLPAVDPDARFRLRNGINGVGGIDGAADLVLSSDERFLYVAGRDADAIAVFSRDPADGGLQYLTRYQDGELGLDGIGGVQRLRLAPGGTHLYAAGTLDDAIVTFALNPGTGALSFASAVRQSQPSMNGLNGVQDFVFSADGAYLFAVADENESLAAFSRNPTSGALTRVAVREEFVSGDGALQDPAAIELADDRLLVASRDNGRVSDFVFDAELSTLTPGSLSINGATGVSDLLYVADQARLHVAARGDSQMQLYSLLQPTPELLDTYGAAAVATFALAPGGRQIYSGGDALLTWERERGSRCPLEGTGPFGSHAVDVAPGGSLIYDIGGDIFPNAVGSLHFELEAQPREIGAELEPADNIAVDDRALAPAPTLSASKTDGLTQVVAGTPISYAIDLDNAGISAAVGARVVDLAPVYPATNAGLVAGSGRWTCAVDPPLALAQTRDAASDAALAGLGRVVASPDGARLYAVNPARGSLLVLARQPDGSLGALQEIANGSSLGGSTVSGLAGASAVAVSADGSTVLVTGASANSLVVFGYDADTDSHEHRQTLTSGTGTVVGLTGPQQVVISPDGEAVYVASAGADSIAFFRRDVETGLLSFVERQRDGFGTIAPDSDVIRGVRALHIDASGANLYAVSLGSQTLSHFAIDAGGALDYRGVVRRTAVAGLAGARELVSSPGGRHLYVLGNGAIVRFDPQADGTPVASDSITGVPGLVQPRGLAMERSGARLYLVDAAGSITTLARDWSTGALAFRHQELNSATPPDGVAASLHLPDTGELLVSVANAGRLQRYDERPLSHCSAAAGTQDGVDTLIELDVTGHAEFDFDAIVHPSARGVLVNGVALTPRSGSSPTAVAGQAQDSTTIVAVSDLSVQKTGPATAVAGTGIQYTIVVGNAGPSDALGMRVVETLPAALGDVQWTCTASGTSTCPASGSTTLDLTATLNVGDTLSIVVDGHIDPAFLGALVNRVDLVPEIGATDPTSGNDSATTSTDVVAQVDVAVTKADAVARVIAGASTVYRIDVANAGPSDAPVVRISDPLPAGIRSTTWTCVPSGGATCPAAGSNALQFDAAMPVGSAMVIEVTAMIADSARGQVTNTVTAQVIAPTTETDPSDNQSSDVNQVDVSADVALSIVDGFDPYDPESTLLLPYVVTVSNLGPSSATQIEFDIDFSTGVQIAPAGCEAVGLRVTCGFAALSAGASQSFTIQVDSLPVAPATLNVQGRVESFEPDPVEANNLASQSTELRAGADLVMDVVRTTPLGGGAVARYEFRIVNIGSVAANDFDVAAAVGAGLIDASWTCTGTKGAICAAGGSGAVVDQIDLEPGQTVTYVFSATVDASLDFSVPVYIEQAASVTGAAGVDLNPANNSDSDRGLVGSRIFQDGFESAAPIRPAQGVAR